MKLVAFEVTLHNNFSVNLLCFSLVNNSQYDVKGVRMGGWMVVGEEERVEHARSEWNRCLDLVVPPLWKIVKMHL